MAWQVEFRAGVWLPQLQWWLDAHFPVARSFVSHAHSDHTALHREILCSEGTAALMRSRLPGDRIEHILPFGQTEQFAENCTVTLHPAGHIFGSAQSLFDHAEHGRLLYTGDFKLRPGRSAERCVTPATDVLIMETTFGRPQYVFPPTAEVLHAIAQFCHAAIDAGETPVLFGYSLGKSQELLSSLAAAGLPVMLHPRTYKLTQIYTSFGIAFPPYREFNVDEVAGHVVICPPQSRDSSFLRLLPNPRTAVATGWAVDPGAIYRSQCDAAFPLSDHADYPDLLAFVEQVQPKRVLTLHGFAADFARTLRERGIEAWAIGEDNQLELGINAAPRPPIAPTTLAANRPADAGTTPSDAPEAFLRFVVTADAVKATTSKLEKITLLRDYLTALAADDAAHAATFFTGRSFPQTDPRNLNLGWAVIKRAVLDVSGLNEADYRAAYQRFADAGDASGAMLAQGRSRVLDEQEEAAMGPTATCSLSAMAEFFSQIATTRGPAAKLELLRERILRLTTNEARYLIKIITGDLRIGLKEGLLEEAIAASTGQPLEAVREANMLSGDIAAVTRAARAGRLGDIQLTVFHPLQFMLASPVPSAETIIERMAGTRDEAPPSEAPASPVPSETAVEAASKPTVASVWLEEKYDGIRCQLHKAGGRIELYSRDLNRITEQFPDLIRGAQEIEGEFIGDGELLAWRDGRALPFAELQKRLGRNGDDFFLGQEIPVSISFYDLLWLNGRSLLKEPLATRRASLERLLEGRDEATTRFRIAPVRTASTAVEIEAAFLAARQRGNEGLMAKDPRSAYTPGRRGFAWVKLKKAYATLDVVVVGAEYGHGKRRDVLSDYTFAIRDPERDRLLTVGKAYSGLTDAEIAQLTQHFLANTLEVHGRYRVVVPDTVIEVAFDIIQPSQRHQSGFALRFPRIARLRPDKTPAEIDTLETCRRLAQAGNFAEAPEAEAPSP